MINYNPKDWFSFIFRFHKADTFRQLFPIIIGITAYTLVIALLDSTFQIGKDSVGSKMSVIHSLLGIVISMLLVFRTNTAYERWWEGRKLWGSLVNMSRNLAIKSKTILPTPKQNEVRQLISAFPFALKNHLRNAPQLNEEELKDLLPLRQIEGVRHTPIRISTRYYEILIEAQRSGEISGEEMLILNLESQQWMEICGACERIRNTPIPFSYSVFLKKFIFFYVMTLPIAYVPVLGFYAIPLVIFIFYVLASLELIAEEIENPFGVDANDLPLDNISRSIRQHVEGIFGLDDEKAR